MKLAIYARVSTDGQAKSLAAQLDRLRAAAGRRWPDAKPAEYAEARSGRTMRRAELVRMLADADAGRLELVLIERLDRLSRRLLDSILIIDRLTRAGVGLVATEHPVDTSTPAGRLSVGLLQAIAEWQREDMLDRSRRGIAAAKARGTHCGRPRASVNLAEIERRRSLGESWDDIASVVGVSRSTLQRRYAADRTKQPGTRRARDAPNGRAHRSADPS